MRNARIAYLLAAATGLWIGCSSSKSTAPPQNPPPTLLGTWHVVITNFSQGTISPDTFSVTLAAGANDTSFAATIPSLTWDGGATFDSFSLSYRVRADTLVFGRLAGSSNSAGCQAIGFFTSFNSAMDTAQGVVLLVPHSQTTYGNGCFNGTAEYHGNVLAVRQR